MNISFLETEAGDLQQLAKDLNPDSSAKHNNVLTIIGYLIKNAIYTPMANIPPNSLIGKVDQANINLKQTSTIIDDLVNILDKHEFIKMAAYQVAIIVAMDAFTSVTTFKSNECDSTVYFKKFAKLTEMISIIISDYATFLSVVDIFPKRYQEDISQTITNMYSLSNQMQYIADKLRIAKVGIDKIWYSDRCVCYHRCSCSAGRNIDAIYNYYRPYLYHDIGNTKNIIEYLLGKFKSNGTRKYEYQLRNIY